MDTSVVVAGIADFRKGKVDPRNASARLLRDWVEQQSFTWVACEEILAEYKAVLRRLGVRRETIGALVNLLREEVEMVEAGGSGQISPDPGDDSFCRCAEAGRADFGVALNPRDFPQGAMRAKVVGRGEFGARRRRE